MKKTIVIVISIYTILCFVAAIAATISKYKLKKRVNELANELDEMSYLNSVWNTEFEDEE